MPSYSTWDDLIKAGRKGLEEIDQISKDLEEAMGPEWMKKARQGTSGIEEVPERQPMSERTRTTRIEKVVDLRDYNAGFEDYKELVYHQADLRSFYKDVYNYIGKRFYREPRQDFITVGTMHRELLTDAGIRTEGLRSYYVEWFYKGLKALAELGLIELN